jgi:hypothetical protein
MPDACLRCGRGDIDSRKPFAFIPETFSNFKKSISLAAIRTLRMLSPDVNDVEKRITLGRSTGKLPACGIDLET